MVHKAKTFRKELRALREGQTLTVYASSSYHAASMRNNAYMLGRLEGFRFHIEVDWQRNILRIQKTSNN